MLLIIQVISILIVCLSGYAAFTTFGKRGDRLLLTSSHRDEWLASMSPRFLRYVNISSIFGTLTSFSTVFLFYLGNTKLFGWTIFASLISLCLSSFITNSYTTSIAKQPRVKQLLSAHGQTGTVLAALIWKESDKGRALSSIVKTVSLLSILGIIWLEFALFTDISRLLLGISIEFSTVFLALITFTVVTFTTSFGLRGVFFADSFQAPMIALGALVVLFGAVIHIPTLEGFNAIEIIKEGLIPIAPASVCILFVFHVFALNLFLPLLSESHWLRLWTFRDTETTVQKCSMIWTSCFPILLIICGTIAYWVSNKQLGEQSIIAIVMSLSNISIVYFSAFWIAATAALFSTADGQIYSFVVVSRLDTKSGEVKDRLPNPFIYGTIFSLGFSCVYYLTRNVFEWPFEKLIFLIVPLIMTILPSVVDLSKGTKPRLWPTLLSVSVYLTFSAIGLSAPEEQLISTLIAAVTPLALSFIPGDRNDG